MQKPRAVLLIGNERHYHICFPKPLSESGSIINPQPSWFKLE